MSSSSVSGSRLRRGGDVRAVFAARTTAHSPTLVVHARLRGDASEARWTVVAGRKVGGAVERNRVKRRLRAALRQVELPAGLDLVVVARQRALSARFDVLCADLRTAVTAIMRRTEGTR